jgi:hypothetical protein
MPYLGTTVAVELSHLISFLEDSNQQMPNVGTTDTVMPFQADNTVIWTFFSALILQDMYIGHSRSHYFLERCVQILATVKDSHCTTWSWTLHCILVALLAVSPICFIFLPLTYYMGPSIEICGSYCPSVTSYPLALTYLMQAVGLVTTFQQASASSLTNYWKWILSQTQAA